MNCSPIKPLLYLIVAFVAQAANAANPTAEQTRFFEESVRPLLAARCYTCHGEEKQRGELRVDSLGGLLAGGESGPAIEPGDPDASLLVEAIRFESYEMPPSGQMPDEEIAILTRWVKLGAPWPGDDGSVRPDRHTGPRITDEDRAWWSFQPIADPEPPQVANDSWCRNDLDRFILRKLASEGLTPADQADRRTLIRRVYFDLIGMPPEPHEVDEFLADLSDDAYARMVDRLLDDSRYGERWARHWLDLVRYAESDGFRADGFRPLAYRYRDYVIRAFNQDKPYDQFVLEQLAGDEVAPHDLDAQAATAYLRHWIYEYNQRDVRTQWDNILVDITNVTGDVFLGLGMGCARCHDHKFDPILRDDYFSLKSFFTPLLPRDDIPYASGDQLAEYQRQQAQWEAKTDDIRRQMLELEQPLIDRAKQRAVEKFPRDIRPMILKSPEDREPLEHQLACLSERQSQAEVAKLDFAKQLKGESLEKWTALKAELDKFDSLRPKPLPTGFTVTDVGSVAPPTTVPGDRSGREIEPAFLTVLDLPPCEIAPPESMISTGRRTALARWLGSPENPLASRVIVNRIWQQHFGVGLVATASDFGHLGELPTHPELLDWLATRFMENGWRFKALHRLILNSATYQQSSLRPAPQIALEQDPGNRWLWRMPVRRLDAEQIRDAVLTVSGELSPTAGGPSVDPSQTRRSIYCRVLRNKRDPLLDAFDAADGFSSTDSRNVTTTPTQSLMMINGPWPLKRARAFASRLRKTNPANDAELVEQAYRLAYSRSPDSLERETAIDFLRGQAEQLQAEQAATAKQEPAVHKMPVLNSQAAQIDGNRPEDRLVLPENESLPSGDFTIEAVIMLRSLYPDATVRTIAAHWDNNNSHPGWALGVTSTKSAYQPRNLILQMVGDPAKGGAGYEVIASNLRPELNKPYYVAASIKIADPSPAGITFYLKDLSKPDAPLQKAQVAHKVTKHYQSPGSLVLGGREDGARHCWDGFLDDVRLTAAALSESELLIHNDSVDQQTVGFWRFEADKGFYQDASPSQNTLFAATGELLDAKSAALVDFCHVLLNSNEFIYVD